MLCLNLSQHVPALNITPLQTVRRRCPAGCRAQKGIAGAFHSPSTFARKKDDCCLSDSSLCTSWLFDYRLVECPLWLKFSWMMDCLQLFALPLSWPVSNLRSSWLSWLSRTSEAENAHLTTTSVPWQGVTTIWQGRIRRETLLQQNQM